MPDEDKEETEETTSTIFPFKVEMQGFGTVTPPGGIRPNGERVPTLEELTKERTDNG